MTRLTLLVLAGLLMVSPAFSSAQSLADVARAEEARRKNVKKAAKVYTNDTLKPDFTMPPSTSSAAPQADAAPTPTPVAPAAPAPEGQAVPASSAAAGQTQPKGSPDEAAWRKRITTARAELQRSQTFAEALQSRINALSADVVNRDDPAQRAVIDQDRQRALAELDRVKNDIAQQTKAISAIEEEARKAGVPAGWLR